MPKPFHYKDNDIVLIHSGILAEYAGEEESDDPTGYIANVFRIIAYTEPPTGMTQRFYNWIYLDWHQKKYKIIPKEDLVLYPHYLHKHRRYFDLLKGGL